MQNSIFIAQESSQFLVFLFYPYYMDETSDQ